MSDDQNDADPLILDCLLTEEELQSALTTHFHEKGLSIRHAAMLFRSSDDRDSIVLKLLACFLRAGALIATGRRHSDDQPRAVIKPSAWYRLNIIGEGFEGVARDQYGTIYFDLLIHPGIEAAKRTLAPANLRTLRYDAIADRIPHGDMTQSEFQEGI